MVTTGSRWIVSAVCAIAWAGCADPPEPAEADSETTDGTGASGAVDGDGTRTESGDVGPRLDLGGNDDGASAGDEASATGDAGEDSGGPSGASCSRIDLLFVIDNTLSMPAAQDAFVTALPAFVADIETTAPEASLHFMVVDTDAHTRCTAQHCDDPSDTVQKVCVLPNDGYACNAEFTSCDHVLGAGVVHPAGAFASNAECDVIGPKRYLDASDADPAASLGCIGRVGAAGEEHARPMDAMQAALSEESLAPTGCNAGFLRDDSVLVVVILSNDPCAADGGMPQGWYDAIVEATGTPQSVVVVGFLPGLDDCVVMGDDPPGCGGASEVVEGAHWAEFVGLWQEHGLRANVCDTAAYPTVLVDAVQIIGETCEGLAAR